MAVASPAPNDLDEQQERAYEALGELEFDLELGKLDEADYKRLYDRYRRQAAAALRAASEREVELDRRIETAVLEARQALPQRASATGRSKRARATDRQAVAQAPRSRSGLNPVLLFGVVGMLFALLATGTLLYYLQGRDTESKATPVSVLSGSNVGSLAVDSTKGQVMLAGDERGILRSADGGVTWSRAGDVSEVVSQVTWGDRGAYALTGEGRLLQSADGGQSWRKVGDTQLRAVAVESGAAGKLYAIDETGALIGSSDGGSNWRKLGGKNVGDVTSLAVASGEPLVLFGTDSRGVVIGRDGTWGRASGVVNGALPTDVVHAVAFDASSGEVSDLPGGGRAEGTLYAATDAGLYKSTDFGTSWVKLGLGGDVTSVAVGPAGSKLLVAVQNNGQVYRSTDRGVTWQGK